MVPVSVVAVVTWDFASHGAHADATPRPSFTPARYHGLVPRPLRLSFIVLGLLWVIYGASTLTDRWLGTPPWWVTETGEDVTVFDATHRLALVQERPGREWISGAVIAVGVGLAAWGARIAPGRGRTA